MMENGLEETAWQLASRRAKKAEWEAAIQGAAGGV
jgi:hypothetical protein